MIPQDFSSLRLTTYTCRRLGSTARNATDVLHLRDVAPLARELSDQGVEALQALRDLDTLAQAPAATVDVISEVRGDL
ncbi:MAG: hypothetical protein ABSB69_07860 [Solirubrobacteraceae bacterium]|jgi:hypothetical protein